MKYKVNISEYGNQYGYPVSITKHRESDDELVGGFTLNNFNTSEEANEFGKTLAEFMKIEIDDGK